MTGAAAGTGRTIALRLAREGYDVVIADVDAARGEATANECGGTFVLTDVTDDDALRKLLAEPVDVLVNNAGGGGHVPPHFPEADVSVWSKWLDLNLRAPMLATQLAGNATVINIASMAGYEQTPYVSPEYGASKAGLIRFSTCLGLGCVVPGWIRTERVGELPADAHIIEPEDVAEAVVGLIHDPGRVVVLP